MRKPYALLLPLLPLLLLAAAPARAADNGSWSVQPVSSAVAARPYFHVSADRGQTIEDSVVVVNKTDEPLTFRLYAADAYNTARDGGFAVRTPGERMRGVGAWAEPAKDRVTVPGRKSVTVPFTIRVPADAEPGDHPGAIVALDERVERADGSVALGVRRPSAPASTSRSAARGCPRWPSRTSASVTTGRSSPVSATARRRSPTPCTTRATSPSIRRWSYGPAASSAVRCSPAT